MTKWTNNSRRANSEELIKNVRCAKLWLPHKIHSIGSRGIKTVISNVYIVVRGNVRVSGSVGIGSSSRHLVSNRLSKRYLTIHRNRRCGLSHGRSSRLRYRVRILARTIHIIGFRDKLICCTRNT